MSTTPAPPALRVAIAWIAHRHLPEAVAISAASHGPSSSAADFIEFLASRNAFGLVAERHDPAAPIGSPGRVVGYAMYALRGDRVDVVDVAVHPGHRRAGVGRQLLARVLRKLSPGRRRVARAIVRETDDDVFAFLASAGFAATGVRRGWHGPDVDGYVFDYLLDEGRHDG